MKLHPNTERAVLACVARSHYKMHPDHMKITSSLMTNDVFAFMKKDGWSLSDVNEYIPEFRSALADVAELRANELITTKHAKEILLAIWETPYLCVSDYIISSKLLEEADDTEIQNILRELMDANPKMVDQIKAGKTNVLGFFVGQTLKKIKADPNKIKELLNKEFGLP
jgi:aspartyl-tRNA(Asn)/glutamyl-tRNA(Gln) amidotransferase subunit B